MLANHNYTGRFSGWGKFPIPFPEAMQGAFQGEPTCNHDGRFLGLFAPLRDSLDDVVAVLEFCLRLNRI